MCAAVCEVEIKRKQILDPIVPQDAELLLLVLTLLSGLTNISKQGQLISIKQNKQHELHS